MAGVEYDIEGYFGPRYGWEVVTCEETRTEAIRTLNTYRDNDPEHLYRIHRVHTYATKSDV